MGGGNFGSANINIGADNTDALKKISDTEKALTRLGSMYSKVAGEIAASFKAVSGATDGVRPRIIQVESALGSVNKQAQTLQKTFNELARIQPFAAAAGAFDKEQLLLPEGLIQQIKELSSTDPFAFLVRGGATVPQAIDAVLNRVVQLEREESKLLQLQRQIRDTPLVGPGYQAILDDLANQITEVQERLQRLGRTATETNKAIEVGGITPSPVQAGQGMDQALDALIKDAATLTDRIAAARKQAEGFVQVVQTPAPQAGAGVNEAIEELVSGARRMQEAIAAANEAALGFISTETIAAKKAQELGKALATSFSGLKAPDLPASGFTSFTSSADAAAQAADALEKEVNQLERQLRRTNDLMAKGSKNPALPADLKRIQDRARELGVELGKSRRQLDSFGKQGGGRVAEFLRRMSGAFDEFGESIEQATGIAESDFAILLGAGLAGGFAGVIRITQKAVEAISQFVDAARKVGKDVDRSFGDAAEGIREFSETAAEELGLSRTEALQTAVAFAELGREIRINSEAIPAFAESLTLTAAAAEKVVPGIHSTEEAMELVQQAVTGSEAALRKLGITSEELNKGAFARFGRGFEQLSEIEQQFVRAQVANEEMRRAIENTGDTTTSAGDRIRKLGRIIGDAFSESKEERISRVNKVLEDLFDQQPTGILDRLNPFADANKDIDEFRKLVKGLSTEELQLLRRKADENVKDKRLRIEIKGIIDEQLKAQQKENDLLAKANLTLEERAKLHEANLKTFLNSISLQREAADAQRALNEAIFDGNRQVEDAEVRLARTREDNARKFRDLQIQSARSVEDAVTRVEAAQLELLDNQNDAQDRVEDAIDRIADAKKQSERAIRDVNERIADKELDHARKVEDYQERIAEAHKEAARAILEAQISIEDAQRRGDLAAFNAAQRQLAETGSDTRAAERQLERDFAREEEDHAIEMGRLRRDLEEARLDGIEAIRRAERDLFRAERDNAVLIAKAQLQLNQAIREEVRAREDAIRALNDLEIDTNRALRDAKRALEEAQIARDRAIASATRAFERLAEKIGLAVDEIQAILIQQALLFPGTVGAIPGRMAGGPVTAHRAYLVGESGPELFVPGTGGSIVNNTSMEKLLQVLLSILNGGGNRNPEWLRLDKPWYTKSAPNIIVHEAADPDATAFAVMSRIMAMVNN